MGKIVVTLKLDRDVYLPGEPGQLTITIRNPTAKKLTIWKPFVNERGTVRLEEKGGVLARAYGLEYGPVSPGPDVVPGPDPEKPPRWPTQVIRGGEQLARTLWFFDRILDEVGAAPSWAGDFRVRYWKKTAAHFQVVRPVFEGSVKIDVPDVGMISAAVSTPQRAELKTHAFVMGYGGKHFVCVERMPYPQNIGSERVLMDGQARALDLALPFRRYSRFAESDQPIGMLRGESDAAGNLALIWQQNDGEHRLNLARSEWQIPGLRSNQ